MRDPLDEFGLPNTSASVAMRCQSMHVPLMLLRVVISLPYRGMGMEQTAPLVRVSAAPPQVRTGWSVSRVLSLVRGGDHPSPAAVADSLQRSTRVLGRAALERTRIPPPGRRDFLTLLQVGFAEPATSPWPLVVSYTAVSP